MSPFKTRAALAVISLLGTAQATHADDAKRLPPQGSVQGVWVWEPVYIENLAEQDRMIAFLKKSGFNRILLQLPWAKGSMATGSPVLDLQPRLAQLLDKAAANGIAVEALDGSPTMGRKSEWQVTAKGVAALLAFNQKRPAGAKFVGLHWDIEPYVSPSWKTPERTDVMIEYLQCLADTKKTLAAADPSMLLSVDIPMWYDVANEPGNSCVVTFNGVTKSLDQHTLDVCDYVGIMSYRRIATGTNSTVEQVTNELNYAEKIGKRICPAIETVPLEETPQITFNGQPPAALLKHKAAIIDALKDRPGFQGVLIHCYPNIRNLLEGTTGAP
ncbi:MAG: hypothetical protein JWM57_3909 [Phycisphaerales bacterium]|nr:hypothetical protein [Phycisphaerales bacterium]